LYLAVGGRFSSDPGDPSGLTTSVSLSEETVISTLLSPGDGKNEPLSSLRAPLNGVADVLNDVLALSAAHCTMLMEERTAAGLVRKQRFLGSTSNLVTAILRRHDHVCWMVRSARVIGNRLVIFT
jgi:hypothetical protein